MITHLMTEDNFDKVLRDDGSPLNVTRARVWFEVRSSVDSLGTIQASQLPALQDHLLHRYCEVFNATCVVSGCGVSDKCRVEEWCEHSGQLVIIIM